jgi:hypothetical protein
VGQVDQPGDNLDKPAPEDVSILGWGRFIDVAGFVDGISVKPAPTALLKMV